MLRVEVVTFAVPPLLDDANIVDSPRIVVNRTVMLECPVIGGVPVPTIRWLKSGQPLQVIVVETFLCF